MSTQSEKSWLLGITTALIVSLCCITPVLALISGIGGIASTFSWLEPARPYLISAAVLVLGFAWYQKLKPRKQEEFDCACETDDKPSFWQSKKFLGIVTVLAVALMAFPNYAHIFYPKPKQSMEIQKEGIPFFQSTSGNTIELTVKGMTCSGCEAHVIHALDEVEGVLQASASFKDAKAIVTFDSAKLSKEDIMAIINATGYKVIE
jgi:mercuric ion transport protein